MPNIRIMNWNIQQFSWNKVQILGMSTAIARTIDSHNIDILVIVEVKKTNVIGAMTTLTTSLNALTTPNTYNWFLSYETGGEYYGFIVRDLNLIRPLAFAANHNVPAAEQTDGTTNRPFNDLRKQRWTTWPDNNWLAPVTFPLPVPHPSMGLCDVYVSRTHPRATTTMRFAGGDQASHRGLSLGKFGSRMPCLALFHIHTPALGDYIIPIIVCHYGAARSGRSGLAQQQVSQLNYLHMLQLFSTPSPTPPGGGAPPPPTAGYLDVDGAANPVINLVFTGDFNMDFKENQAGGTSIPNTNRNAYNSLTPTAQQGGSTAPAALAGGAPTGGAPAVPFAAPFNPGPTASDIPDQALRASVTLDGTILLKYDELLNPLTTAAIRGAAFDNFFYGGTQLTNATLLGAALLGPPPVNDSGLIIDVPTNIVKGGVVNAWDIDLGTVWTYHNTENTRNAAQAQDFNTPGTPLTVKDRWIGAGFVSDHLPVVLQFNCP